MILVSGSIVGPSWFDLSLLEVRELFPQGRSAASEVCDLAARKTSDPG